MELAEDQQKSSSAVGTAGFFLLDSTLNPIYVNKEAIRILAYPGDRDGTPYLKEVFERMVRLLDLKPTGALEKYSLIRFMSGRRNYTCRVFPISPFDHKPQHPMMALLIERNPLSSDLLAMAEKFNLTKREREAVQHLALGLTSKEIAARMGISSNTVKAFLKLAMLKTGVTTRSGIIGKCFKHA
jgi:DNA-binding CsgD family transcriptional regulator